MMACTGLHIFIFLLLYIYLGRRQSPKHVLTFWFSFQLFTPALRITVMVDREFTMANMGRGAYDTTGVPKPPPRPKPR
ncbi:hypothetical protein F5Y13DRAFT_33945 [Hypoxylon sp. FL1857]|nr:hypothetical protein F5Y13DRAFT_33945 [Hypoxylon sp. FL1857]